jgi:hypothetical protein
MLEISHKLSDLTMVSGDFDILSSIINRINQQKNRRPTKKQKT